MGYTHYWRVKIDTPKEIVKAALEDCKTIVKQASPMLAGADGNGEPNIEDDFLMFNGKGDNAHETFVFPPGPQQEWQKGDSETFDFCKTARKPYDSIVTACLVAIKDQMGEYVKVSSDGTRDDWENGVGLAEEALDRKIDNPIG